MEKFCSVCGKVFNTPDKRRKYCSSVCYHKTKRGKPFGGALNTGKGTRGKYSDFQVNQMTKGKHDAYLQRVKQDELLGKYDLKRIEQILENCYVTNLRALCKMLINNDDRTYTKELKYLFEYKGWSDRLCKFELPECYRVMSPEQIDWFRGLLIKSTNFYDFTKNFLENYKIIGVRGAARLYKNLMCFVQATNFETRVLNKNLSKNLSGCGSSCESKVRSVLIDLGVDYVEQACILHSEYKCINESINRFSYYKPDFIVDNKFIIEVNGDYWHAFGLDESQMNKTQLDRKLKDLEKYKFYKDNDFHFIIIWEHDLVNINKVIDLIRKEVNNEINYKRIIYK